MADTSMADTSMRTACLKLAAASVLCISAALPALADMNDLPILASPDSLLHYKAAVEASPKDADALAKLGHAYLALDSLEQAERQFHQSIKRGKRPEAYYGLALSYWRKTKRQQMIMAFRIEPNLKKAIKRDPSFGPAYLGLSEWYHDTGFADRLIEYLEAYASYHPDDLDGRYRLAVAHIENEDYAAAQELAEKTVKEGAGGNRWLPFIGQGYAASGDAGQSLGVWHQHINGLSQAERILYRDLQLIATKSELEEMKGTSRDTATILMRRFWQRRDPTMVSGGKGREAEHYRRVWYAVNFLSDVIRPWDLRGEVYIRYGEPDYRSRSDRTNRLPPHAAVNVKERIFNQLFQDIMPDTETEIGPVFPVGTYSASVADPPVDWESWVYTALGRGVEFVFEDELKNGRWRWPPIPKGWTDNVSALSRNIAFNPGLVYQGVSQRTPDHFDLPPGYDPLGFYYSTATFRGQDGRTVADVYFGIPPSAEPDTLEGRLVTRVNRLAVIGTDEREVVVRLGEQLTFSGPAKGPKGIFFPDVTRMAAAPGDYQLSVQVSDLSNGKWGVYVQDLELPDYTGGLAISDVAVAFTAGEMLCSDRFRRGGIVMVPMPSRTFRHGQHPWFYYEVYNLTVDEFGRTRYRIDYEIRRHRRRSNTVAGLVGSGLSSLFRGRKPSFEVGYDRDGDSEWEPIYFELDTDQVEPGVNMLTVELTDLLSGETVAKEAIFRLDEPVEKPPTIQDVRRRRRGFGR